MTVDLAPCKIGNEKLIRASDSASNRLKTLLSQDPKPFNGLRLSVIGGGCSGLQYDMTIVDAPTARDIMVETQCVRLIVDPKSALYVSGSMLDYSDDLQKGGFQVTNPNATAHCSCGQSFSV